MTRKKIREHIFIVLFQVDYHQKEEWEDQIGSYLDTLENASKKAKTEIREKVMAIVDHMSEIDAIVEKNARGWTLNRLAKADITILRLAIYEIIFDAEVPNGVAINEAVELAKIYGTEKSSSFVNGILASIAKEYPEKTEENQNKEE